MPAYFSFLYWIKCQVRRDDKIDRSDILEHDFERVSSVRCIGVRIYVENKALGLWIQVRRHLRIVNEDIDVKAFAVMDLKHQRNAPAETPSIKHSEF